VQTAAERLRAQPNDLFGDARQAEQASEEGGRRRGACTLERVCQTASRDFRLILAAQAGEAADELGIRPVRKRGAVGQASRPQPPQPELGCPGLGGLAQARLPDARFACDGDDPAAPVAEGAENVADGGQLSVAADEGRSAMARPEPRRSPSAKKPPCWHGLRLSLERQLADRPELEHVVGQPLGQLADVGLAGGRGRLEPLRENHRVAEDGVVHPRLTAKDTGDPVARVDACVQGQLRVVRELAADSL
jgi:hypothetical protein